MSGLIPEQLKDIDLLRQKNPEVHYETHEKEQRLVVLSGLSAELKKTPVEDGAMSFIAEHQRLFGLSDATQELRKSASSSDHEGWKHITFQQLYKGVPVYSGSVTVHLNQNQRIQSISNSVRTKFPDVVTAKITADEAVKQARANGKHTNDDKILRKPELFIFPDDQPKLVWIMAISGQQPSYLDLRPLKGGWTYFVDATNGKIIKRIPMAKEGAQTSTGLSVKNPGRLNQVTLTLQTWHDPASGKDQLRDTVTGAADSVEILTNDGSTLSWDDNPAPLGNNTWNRITGETSAVYTDRVQYQPAEAGAHYNGGQLYLFWRRAPFNRHSLDNAGCDIRLKTHQNSTSAWWDGTNINLGDGDMNTFTFKGGEIDVMGHESTHGVMSYEVAGSGGLTYSGQSGNAEESFCDIFGSFSDHDWLFEYFVTVPPYTCLRNLQNPTDPNAISPGHNHYADYVSYGGGSDPHTNCHILNHGCYLMTNGGVHHRAGRTPADIPVYPGMNWLSAETIYYRAITEGFTANPGLGTDTDPFFAEVRRQVLLAAEWAYGVTSSQYKTAKLAFYAIGLQPAGDAYGPDVAITPWGNITHTGVGNQSPDFVVKDAANNPVQPQRGIHNRLFIKIRNIGDQTANNIQVRTSYSPYNASYPHTNFKQIGMSTPITLTSGQETEVEFDWDMTNLDENNGGLWPMAGGLAGIRGYDHFCTRAEIICPSDVDVYNNSAQNNFSNVVIHPGDMITIPFLVASPIEKPTWGKLSIVKQLSRTWSVSVEGMTEQNRIRLDPKKATVMYLKVKASDIPEFEPPISGEIEGSFGPRILAARLIPLRVLGKFSGEMVIDKYSATRTTFSGTMKGKLLEKGQEFSGFVSGKVVDIKEMSVTGNFEGHLGGALHQLEEPVKLSFKGVLSPWRDISVMMDVEGQPLSGFTMRFTKKK